MYIYGIISTCMQARINQFIAYISVVLLSVFLITFTSCQKIPGHATGIIPSGGSGSTGSTGSTGGGSGSTGGSGGSGGTTSATGSIVYVAHDTIFYLASLNSAPKAIVTTYGEKQFVRISHDHTKIAYLYFGSIEIDNISGQKITTVNPPANTYYREFDWSADDKTLYILDFDGKVSYYGPSMNLPAFVFPSSISGNTNKVISMSVSTKGDLAYVVLSDMGGIELYEMCILPAGGSSVIEYNTNTSSLQANFNMASVRFSNNAQDLVLGYQEAHDNFINMYALDVFTGLKKTPDKHLEIANISYCDAIYNSSVGYIVGGYNTDITTTNTFLSTIDINTGKNIKALSSHGGEIGGYYSDWK